MRSSRRGLLKCAAALPLPGCAALAGPPALPGVARERRFVLLGELHDRAAHHRLRAAWIAQLAAATPTRLRIVFEQMDRGRDAAIAQAQARGADADAIADAAALDRAGWRWPLHRPLVEAALAARAEIVGGNLSREAARAVVRDAAAVPDDLAPALRDPGWTDALAQRLVGEIADAHGDALPAALVPGLVRAQRLRDAALAQAMSQGLAPGRRAVLIAGNGHVRDDLGVPHQLRRLGVARSDIASVLLLDEGVPAMPADAVLRLPA
ncbi:ChaN family lipoprotein [Aquabacterium sp. J223]|uniref:ChaN family lipoprotein n=1 Tax=Aquabacterium sp. J223 TaxID=2898431 RepID=UPI0021AE0FC9|nr:ChaN family lipoprotein [Aquabacterium sp. J223]UUX97155.1 ChaN family lipoprotein [Aquabacterium sp. J223]